MPLSLSKIGIRIDQESGLKGSLAVESVSPLDSATNVDVKAEIVVTFDKSINYETLTGEVIIRAGEDILSHTTSAENNVVTIVPDSDLPPMTEISVTLGTGIESTAGRTLEEPYIWSFTTVQTYITVESVTPADEATGVNPNVVPTATFSDDIDTDTLTGRVSVTADSVPVDVTCTYPLSVLTITPDVPFNHEAVIEVTLYAGIATSEGAILASDYVWSFTAIDALTVESVTPLDSATDIDKAVEPVVIFNRNVNLESLDGKIALEVSSDGETYTAASFTYGVVDDTLTITPDSEFDVDAYVRITLSEMISGTGGCYLEDDYIWDFRIESNFYMFKTNDSLQPVAGVDWSPGLTHTFVDPNEEEDLLDEDYRLYGTHCLKLGGDRAWEITGAASLLALTIKNMLFNIFIPSSTDTTYSIMNVLNSSDESLCNIAYNASTGVLSVGSAYTAGPILTEGQYNVFQFIESSGNYTLKINDSAVSMTGTQAVPTSGIAKLVIGESTTDAWYFDNTMMAK